MTRTTVATATSEPTATSDASEPAAPPAAAFFAPTLVAALAHALRRRRGEEGLATAEVLAIAALSVAALVVIFGLLTDMGERVVAWIEGEILAS